MVDRPASRSVAARGARAESSDLEHEIARQRCRQRGEIGRDRGCRVEPRIKDIADGGDAGAAETTLIKDGRACRIG